MPTVTKNTKYWQEYEGTIRSPMPIDQHDWYRLNRYAEIHGITIAELFAANGIEGYFYIRSANRDKNHA